MFICVGEVEIDCGITVGSKDSSNVGTIDDVVNSRVGISLVAGFLLHDGKLLSCNRDGRDDGWLVATYDGGAAEMETGWIVAIGESVFGIGVVGKSLTGAKVVAVMGFALQLDRSSGFWIELIA